MLTAVLSFFGGNAFRWIFGEVIEFLNRRQEHAQELERMNLENTLEAARHERDQARIRLQADLGVKEVMVQTDAAMARVEADAWLDAVKSVGRATGIKWLDAWNGSIRPFLASVAVAIVVADFVKHDFKITEFIGAIVSGILGIYIADRQLQKKYGR